MGEFFMYMSFLLIAFVMFLLLVLPLFLFKNIGTALGFYTGMTILFFNLVSHWC